MARFGITKEIVAEIMEKDTFQKGLQRYLSIMDNLDKTNVSLDVDYQRKYNGFYRMRQRSRSYYYNYFLFLQQHKNNAAITFEMIANHLYQTTGRFELSFSSKLLATINPKMPVWDKVVAIDHFGLSLSSYTPRKYSSRLDMIIEKYDQFYFLFNEYAETNEAKIIITTFKERFPYVNITNTKMIDFVLWQHR